MTEQQFDIWYADYCRSFPSTAAWLNELPPDVKSHQKRLWLDSLREVELTDAKAATLRLVLGDERDPTGDKPGPWTVPGYERELTGAHVRRIASSIASERNSSRNRDRTRESLFAGQRGAGDGGISLGGIFREIVAVLDKGGSQADALALVNERFPARQALWEGRRYRCRMCLDTRVVYVWSPVSIRAVLEGKINEHPRFRKACGADCLCSKEPRERLFGGDKKKFGKFTFFDETRHCECPGGAIDEPENIDALVLWVEKNRDGYDRRHTEFDEYNERKDFQ